MNQSRWYDEIFLGPLCSYSLTQVHCIFLRDVTREKKSYNHQHASCTEKYNKERLQGKCWNEEGFSLFANPKLFIAMLNAAGSYDSLNIGEKISSFKRSTVFNAISIDIVQYVTKFYRQIIGNTCCIIVVNNFLVLLHILVLSIMEMITMWRLVFE